MSRRMKELRPTWRVGVVVAKAVGDVTSLRADFLAVEAGLATRAFVRQAHQARKDVYVWTVNDAAGMVEMVGRGADGIITDEPGIAVRVRDELRSLTSVELLLLRFSDALTDEEKEDEVPTVQ